MEHPYYQTVFLNALYNLVDKEDLALFDEVCPMDLEDFWLNYACRMGNMNLVRWRFEMRNSNPVDTVYFFLLALVFHNNEIADYISNMNGPLDEEHFFRTSCVAMIAKIVEDNNTEAMKRVVSEGFSLEGDEETSLELIPEVTTRAMIRTLHQGANADLRLFDNYFAFHFLMQGRYEVVEYLQEMGVDIFTTNMAHMDEQELQSYHQALNNYRRWHDLKSRCFLRHVNKMWKLAMEKLRVLMAKNTELMQKQALTSYYENFPEMDVARQLTLMQM